MPLDGESRKHRLVHVFANNDYHNEMPAADNGHVVGQAVVNERCLCNEAKQGREKGVEGLLVGRRAGELLVDLLNGNESVVKRLRSVIGVGVASEMRSSESEGCVCQKIVLSRVLGSAYEWETAFQFSKPTTRTSCDMAAQSSHAFSAFKGSGGMAAVRNWWWKRRSSRASMDGLGRREELAAAGVGVGG